MSIKRMTAVWELSEHKGSALLLMLAIADIADDLGVAWPGYGYLAHKIRMGRDSVIRLADVCHESGELWKLPRPHQRSNMYIITIGLSRDTLGFAAEKAVAYGVVPPRGSRILIPPPQALVVVGKSYHLAVNSGQVVGTSDQVVGWEPPGGRIAILPDPSLPVITLKDGNSLSWDSVLVNLRNQMDRLTFDAHLLGSTAREQDGQLIVTVRNPQSVEWLTHRLGGKVAAALAQQGHEAGVVFTWEAAQ